MKSNITSNYEARDQLERDMWSRVSIYAAKLSTSVSFNADSGLLTGWEDELFSVRHVVTPAALRAGCGEARDVSSRSWTRLSPLPRPGGSPGSKITFRFRDSKETRIFSAPKIGITNNSNSMEKSSPANLQSPMTRMAWST